jgi:hypothetical protein
MFIARKPPAASAGGASAPVTTVTQSAAVSTNDLDPTPGINVEIHGITTGTVDVESTIDGSTWVKEGSSLTADGRVKISSPVSAVRANVKVATTVSVTLVVGGLQYAAYGGAAK